MDSKPSSSGDEQPGEAAAGGLPESLIPRPNIVTPEQEAEAQSKKGRSKRDRRSARSHPLDSYKPLKKRRHGCVKGCGCSLLILAATVALVVALAGAAFYFGPWKALLDEYELVVLDEADSIVFVPPAVPTVYFGQAIDYEAGETDVPVAFFAVRVSVSGDFREDVHVTGVQVTGAPLARFAKGLEIYAVEFRDEGIEVDGVVDGRVMSNVR